MFVDWTQWTEHTTEDIGTHYIARLWADAGIQETFTRRGEFQISENVAYFKGSWLSTLVREDYAPPFSELRGDAGFNEESFLVHFSSDARSRQQEAQGQGQKARPL